MNFQKYIHDIFCTKKKYIHEFLCCIYFCKKSIEERLSVLIQTSYLYNILNLNKGACFSKIQKISCGGENQRLLQQVITQIGNSVYGEDIITLCKTYPKIVSNEKEFRQQLWRNNQPIIGAILFGPFCRIFG